MKDLSSLKVIATLLSILLIVQSCSVYEKTPISVAEAASFDKSIYLGNQMKIISKSGEEYIFNEIYYENNQLFGKTVHSRTIGKLKEQIVAGKIIFQPIKIIPSIGETHIKHQKKIILQEEDISSIHMMNTTKTIMAGAGIWIGVVAIGTGLLYWALTSSI